MTDREAERLVPVQVVEQVMDRLSEAFERETQFVLDLLKQKHPEVKEPTQLDKEVMQDLMRGMLSYYQARLFQKFDSCLIDRLLYGPSYLPA